ncbi:MAG: hypothetical protein QM346_15915 [Chloroflexota bacterium]|nr:hypothetical protein [Chloroflexota bacterium]
MNRLGAGIQQRLVMRGERGHAPARRAQGLDLQAQILLFCRNACVPD